MSLVFSFWSPMCGWPPPPPPPAVRTPRSCCSHLLFIVFILKSLLARHWEQILDVEVRAAAFVDTFQFSFWQQLLMMLLIFFTNRTSLSPLLVKNDITLGTALRVVVRIQPCIAPNMLQSCMYVWLLAILDICISTPPGEFWFPSRSAHCILSVWIWLITLWK